MFSVIITFILAFVSVHAQSFNCAKFWPAVTPGEMSTINDQCYLSTDFPPQAIYGVSITIAYVQGMYGNPFVSIYAGQIHQAILEALNVYEDLQASFAGVVVILTNRNDPNYPDAKADTYRPANGACQIRVYNNWIYDLNDDEQLQAIAHEMYHCAQVTWAGNPEAGSLWWVEGSADYFSNVVYPSTNYEWKHAAYFEPQDPIYAQNIIYCTDQFFQSLEQSKGASGIHQWVQLQQYASDPQDERTRLSNVDDFADDFHLFAKQFTLGQIYDTDGQLMPITNPVVPAPVVLTPTDDEDTMATVSLSLVPFTIGQFSFPLDAGQTVAIYYSTELSNVRISYAQQDDTVWTTMPNSPSSSAAGTLVLGCNDGNPITIYVLLTSCDDVDTASAVLTLIQTYQDTTCACNPAIKRGLQVCTTSSVSSASSTPTLPPTSSPTGSCTKISSLNTDPCIVGPTWNLDLPDIEDLMKQKLTTLSDVTINSLSLSGSGTLVVEGTNATFTYTDLIIDLDITSEGIDVSTNTVVNGDFEANLYMQQGGSGTGDFCLDVYSGEGTADITTSITGEISLDLGPGGGFVEEQLSIQYTCTPGQLTMQGYLDGNTAWGPYVYTT
jgi:hypothetical protein